MTTLIVVTIATLAISALCSLFEAVLYSTRVATIEAARMKMANAEGLANRMINLKRSIADPIAAILILNTIANTAGCTLAGILAAKFLSAQGVVIFSSCMVVGILFISEIIPKTMGAVYWRSTWTWIVWPITILKGILFPIIWLVQRVTHLITRDTDPTKVTEEEILAMISLGAAEGQLSAEEGQMVCNIIDLENKYAKDILTPRVVMFSLDAETTVKEAVDIARSVGFSRIPIYKEHPENISGYVLRRELHMAIVENPSRSLQTLAKSIAFVPETANCLTLLNQFLKHRRHIAVVTDEYGGLAGILTLEDLLETLLGSEIVDETDRHIDMQEVAQRRKNQQTGISAPEPPLPPQAHA